MADDTHCQCDDKNRQRMRIADVSRVWKAHEEDSTGKSQIRQRQADLGEGGRRTWHLQRKAEELDALYPPPERSIRRCERESPSAESDARRFRQPHTL